MSYTTLLSEEGIVSQFLAVLRPKRKVTSWSLTAGSVYQNSFDYGRVYSVSVDGTALTAGSTSSLSAGYYYYDVANQILYVRTADSANPTAKFVVVTYELYCGTIDGHWYRIPTDSTTDVVYFEPVIKKSPEIKSTVASTLFGYLPVQTSSIILNNSDHLLEKHLYDSSFSQAEIKIYHWLDELKIGNIQLVYNGLMGNVSYDTDTVTIKTYDGVDVLNQEYRNSGGDESFYDTSLFANVDPNSVGRPIRKVFGVVSGYVPVNVSYVQDNPTTSNNRIWCVMSGQSNLAEIDTTVPASPACTTTRTYVQPGTALGIQVGDSIWITGSAPYYCTVTAIDASGNYIDHTANALAAVAADRVRRSFIGDLNIVQGEIIYTAKYGRDYTTGTMAGGTVGFTFSTSLEANLSMPSTLAVYDKVYCKVYGQKNAATIGGVAFGSNDSSTNNLTHPTVILYHLLKDKLGIPESSINTSSFQAVQAATPTEAIGLAIPDKTISSFPDYKDIVIDLLTTQLTKLYLDSDGKWKLSRLAPYATQDSTYDYTEIIDNSFGYDINYSDVISDVIVEYNFSEQSDNLNLVESKNSITKSSSTAKYLHGIKKQKTFKSLHFRSADATTLANRLIYILGDREGTIKFSLKNKGFSSLIADKVKITREKLPGFAYVEDTSRSVIGLVNETSKGLKKVTLTLDDSKGMNDNSGSW